MKTFKTYLLMIFCLVMAVLLVLGFLFYNYQKNQLKKEAINDLTSIIELKVERLVSWRKERLGDAYVTSKTPFLVNKIETWLKDHDEKTLNEILKRFKLLKEYNNYTDIKFLDLDSNVQIELDSNIRVYPEGLKSAAEAVKSKKTVFSDFHLTSTSGPHFSIVAPVFSTDDPNMPIGTFIFSVDAHQFLYPMIQSWPVRSMTAETFIVRREGDSVLFLNDLRHMKDTALKLKIPLTRKDVPAVMAVLGKEGVIEGADYRGTKVFSVIKAVPDSPWFMVSKIDQDEALGGWKFKSTMILSLIFLSLISSAFAAYALWQKETKTHLLKLLNSETRLQLSEERFKATLASIGDGVIATDSKGKVEFMNSVAETLTGWDMASASGEPLGNVFKVINEDTRQIIENPVAKIFKEGKIVGLANHTLLISKDGSEHPIADCGAPILDQNGNLTGVVLVFRDQANQRKLEKMILQEKKKVETIINASPVGMMLFDERLSLLFANPSAESMFRSKPANEMRCGDFILCINRSKDPRGCGYSDKCQNCALFIALRDTLLGENSYSGETALDLEGRAEPIYLRFKTKPIRIDSRKALILAADDITEQKKAEEDKERLEERLH